LSSSSPGRLTRRRSSAGPLPPNRPQRPRESLGPTSRSTIRTTFLTLRDHGKVFVADLPRLSDGQLANVGKEAREVLESLNRRLQELEGPLTLSPADQETRIRASTKRDVTERFIRSVEEELEQRRSNPALRAAAGGSLPRAFLEIARHRLPGATFDSLLQEALGACDALPMGVDGDPDGLGSGHSSQAMTLLRYPPEPPVRRETLPVVLTPDPPSQAI
jgi:hypothetical protein